MPEFQFDSLVQFLAMGGYAMYVWPVYILFALFFVTTVLPPKLGRKKILKQLKARMERMDNTLADSMKDSMKDSLIERGESH